MPKLEEFSDIELLSLIQTGDSTAFACLYNRFKRPLLIHALQRLDDIQAEDAVHDVFAKLWDQKANVIIQVSLRAYLFTSLRNRIIDIMIHASYGDKYIASLTEFANAYVVEKTDYKVREKMFAEQIDRAMMAFSEREREILKLRMEGYKNPEIADKLGISEKTIRNQYSNIIKKLKSKFSHLHFLLLF